METLRIILRLTHIFSGTMWVGSAIFMTLFLEPVVRAAGAEGGRFMSRLVTTTSVAKYMAGSSLLTVLAGIVLYGLDASFNSSWVTSREGIIFSIGSLAGIIAFATGTFVIAPTSRRIGALGAEIAMAGGPPTTVQLNEMTTLQERAQSSSRLEVILMVITVLGMAGARLF